MSKKIKLALVFLFLSCLYLNSFVTADLTQLNLTGVKIVDPNNINSGLMPEVFHGILAFLSCNLVTIIVIVFVVLIALSFLAICGIIVNIVKGFT